MAKSAGDIFYAVEQVLFDWSNTHAERTYTAGSQTKPSLLFMLRRACDALQEVKPSAFVSVANLQLSTQGVRHTLPSTAYRLLDIIRNRGSDGTANGNKISYMSSRKEIDAVLPAWHSEELVASNGIENYYYNFDEDPRTVWVYPGVPSTGWYVEAATSDYPGTISDADTELEVFTTYYWSLVYHVTYQIFMGEHKFSSPEWAQSFLSKFYVSAGVTT